MEIEKRKGSGGVSDYIMMEGDKEKIEDKLESEPKRDTSAMSFKDKL